MLQRRLEGSKSLLRGEVLSEEPFASQPATRRPLH